MLNHIIPTQFTVAKLHTATTRQFWRKGKNQCFLCSLSHPNLRFVEPLLVLPWFDLPPLHLQHHSPQKFSVVGKGKLLVIDRWQRTDWDKIGVMREEMHCNISGQINNGLRVTATLDSCCVVTNFSINLLQLDCQNKYDLPFTVTNTSYKRSTGVVGGVWCVPVTALWQLCTSLTLFYSWGIDEFDLSKSEQTPPCCGAESRRTFGETKCNNTAVLVPGSLQHWDCQQSQQWNWAGTLKRIFKELTPGYSHLK